MVVIWATGAEMELQPERIEAGRSIKRKLQKPFRFGDVRSSELPYPH
jgi:hypothetical protein